MDSVTSGTVVGAGSFSCEHCGYTLTLDTLKLHSMLVDHDALTIDVDAAMSIE